MPLGNLVGSPCRLPAESRFGLNQQSSTTTYWYPASRMPLLTIASADCRMSVSLMLQPKEFHESQPIGGVRATPFSSACTWGACMPIAAKDRTMPTVKADRRRQWDRCGFIDTPYAG